MPLARSIDYSDSGLQGLSGESKIELQGVALSGPTAGLSTTVTVCYLIRNSIRVEKRAVSDSATHRHGSTKCWDGQFRIPISILAYVGNMVKEVSVGS